MIRPVSKAVVPVLVLLFVALWFILRGDLLYVFPCVILILRFSVLLVLRLPRLGKRELILVLFIRLFGLCLFRFVGFLFLLGSGKGCGCDCGTPWTFLLPFLYFLCSLFPSLGLGNFWSKRDSCHSLHGGSRCWPGCAALVSLRSVWWLPPTLRIGELYVYRN